jgi:hypothetical protein
MIEVNPFCLSQSNRRRISARFQGVQDDSPRPHPLDCVGNSNEETLEVILAGFPKFAACDGNMVDEQFLFRHQPVQVEPQRSDILGQVGDRFLERYEHAGFAELGSAPNQELQAEQRLSGSGTATDESRAAPWQPSPRDFIQTLDASGCFRQRVESWRV